MFFRGKIIAYSILQFVTYLYNPTPFMVERDDIIYMLLIFFIGLNLMIGNKNTRSGKQSFIKIKIKLKIKFPTDF